MFACYLDIFNISYSFKTFQVIVNLFGCNFILKVCLTIQVFGLNVAEPIYTWAFNQQEIRREELILFDVHDAANLQLLPISLHNFTVFDDRTFGVVFFTILYMPLVVFISILYHANGNNDE